jgi:hypothetical protein
VVDKAVVIENKIKEMEKDGKRKVSFQGANINALFFMLGWPWCGSHKIVPEHITLN